MALNWTLEVFFSFITLIPLGICLYISLKQYFKTRYQHSLYLSFIWISYGLWWALHGLSKLFLSKSLYFSTGVFITANLVTIILFSESLERDLKISTNLLLVILLQTIFIVSLYDENVVSIENYANNELGLRVNNPIVQWTAFFEMILSTLYVLNVMIKIYRNVPAIMKKKTLPALIGVSFFSSFGVFYVMFGGDNYIPGLNLLFTFLGAMIFGISFLREPKIFHVLSFKMLRLQIMDIKSGIGVYSYTWAAGKEIGDETLFSGMIQGIGLILQESVKRGTVDEIQLTQGILIIQRIPNSSIACVLVATQSTASLRSALENFAVKFEEKFHDAMTDICDLTVFDSTSELIQACFPFL